MNFILRAFIALALFLSHQPNGMATEMDNAKGNISEGYNLSFAGIKRDQPRIKRIFEWGGRIIVHAGNIFYGINIEQGSAVPLSCPGDRDLIDLAADSSGSGLMLCKEERGLQLYRQNKVGGLDLPDELQFTGPGKNTILLSNDQYFVILTDKKIFSFDGRKWKQVGYKDHFTMQSRQLFTTSLSDHFKLYKDKILIGHDWGEFGGGLAALDIHSGNWSKYRSDNVTDLVINSKGELWVSQGGGHMGMIGSMLEVFDGKSWTSFAETSGILEYEGRKLAYVKEKSRNWPYDPVVYESLYFDKEGSLLVSTDSHGIFKHTSDGKWIHLVKAIGSPETYFPIKAFLIHGDTMVMGLYDAGIILLDLTSGKYRHMKLAEVLG